MFKKSIEYNKRKDKEYDLACIKCSNETTHKVLFSVSVFEEDTDDRVQNCKDYEIISCQGCKEISFRDCYSCSEDTFFDPETGESGYDETINLYPNRIVGRKELKDKYNLPYEIKEIYNEVHKALIGELNILASIGMRKLIETICEEKETKGNDLKEKIDDLVKKEIITKDNANFLHKVRFLGNKSAHEIIFPKYEELEISMEIIETILKNVYILPKKAEKLNFKKEKLCKKSI